MEFYITNLSLDVSSKASRPYKVIKLEIKPACSGGSEPRFIKLPKNRFVCSRELKKYGFDEYGHEKIEAKDVTSIPFYLEIEQLQEIENIPRDEDADAFILEKEEEGRIYLIDDEDFNYKYESHYLCLFAKLILRPSEFDDLWQLCANNRIPNKLHLFIDHKYTESFDYYCKPWTPWDLSEIESSSYYHPDHASVKINHYRFEFNLLSTNEHEIFEAEQSREDRLNGLSADYLYDLSNDIKAAPVDVLIPISRQLFTIIVALFILILIFLFK